MDYGYHKYFEGGTFWRDVKRCENQHVMAGAIWFKFRKLVPMIKIDSGQHNKNPNVDSGKEAAGHWAWQLSILCDDVENAKTLNEALGFISTFRLSAGAGRNYQRRPEKQTALFTSPVWKK